jgi:hypothetical protein
VSLSGSEKEEAFMFNPLSNSPLPQRASDRSQPRKTLGDFFADDSGLGYERAAIVFAVALAIIAAIHFYTKVSPTLLFSSAFILTRPLGATVGDLSHQACGHGWTEPRSHKLLFNHRGAHDWMDSVHASDAR